MQITSIHLCRYDPSFGYDQAAIDEEAAQVDWDAILAEKALMEWDASRSVALQIQDENCEPF
jgi:hypothetical protein